MRVAELEKEKKKDKREKSTLLEKIVTLEEDIEVLSRAVRSSEQKLCLELFVRFGSSSERYRKYFNISEELIRKAEEEQLSDEEQKIIDNGPFAVCSG